jgi:hypothetical protein
MRIGITTYAAVAHAARGESGARMRIASSATTRNATITAPHANGVGDQIRPTSGNATSGSPAVAIRRKISSGALPNSISAMRAMSSATHQKTPRNSATKTTSRNSVGKCAMRRPVTMYRNTIHAIASANRSA